MSNNIKLYNHVIAKGALESDAFEEIPLTCIRFPGGEPHISIPDISANTYYRANKVAHAIIFAKIHNGDDMMATLALTDAVRRLGIRRVSLVCPYFPGARQDRYELGGSITAKVYANLINSQFYNKVVVLDPHSPITPALLDNCHVVSQSKAITLVPDILFDDDDQPKYNGLICPDKGAVARSQDLFSVIQSVYSPIEHQFELVYADKVRNPTTGKLSGFKIDQLKPGRYLLGDDICDGGGTYIGLSDIISKEIELDLFVTHGIFSKGIHHILNRFSTIITTDSLNHATKYVEESRLQIINMTSFLLNELRWN